MDQSIKLLTDQAIYENYKEGEGREDSLSFDSYAQVIKKVVFGTDGPFTIGIFGEWGTGKTSLLKMIENRVNQEPGNTVIPVWFNAWKFENVEHPIVPLIATIISELEKNKPKLNKLQDGGKTLIRSLRAIAYGFATNTKINMLGFAEVEAGFVAKDMIDRDENLSYDPLLEKSLYHLAFERLDKVSLGNGSQGIKILVIVDDLDRCFPENSIKLLESIKLVLSQAGFLFVLGVSRRVIEEYLKHKYEEIYGIKDFEGSAYLDKIIQLSFDIPPHVSRMEYFAKKLVENLEDLSDKSQLSQIASVMGVACNNNPRTVVRFINRLLIDKAIYTALPKQERQIVPIGYFAVTRSLEMQWKSVFKLLTSDDPDTSNLCTQLASWNLAEIDHWRNYSPSKRTPTIKSSDPKTVNATLNHSEEVDLNKKQIAEILSKDINLQKLLFSQIGKDWLRNKTLRKSTIDFIIEQDNQEFTNEDLDPLLEEIKSFIQQYPRASASFLQRKLTIGYARAARIMDQLEELGIVGPSIGAEPREVFIYNPNAAPSSSSDIGIKKTKIFDPLIEDAIRLIITYDVVSASFLQRKLAMGFARAARIMDQLEELGVVEIGEGGKPRKVLIQDANLALAKLQVH